MERNAKSFMRVITFMLVFTMILGNSANASFDSKNDIVNRIDKTGAKIISEDEIPENLIPLEMSIDEYEKYVVSLNKEIVEEAMYKRTTDPSTRSIYIDYSPFMKHIVGIAWVKTYTDLTYADGSSIVDVDRVRSKLEGVTVGLNLKDVTTSYTLLDSSRTIKVTSYYTVENIVYVNGFPVLYSVDYKATLKWNTINGYLERTVKLV